MYFKCLFLPACSSCVSVCSVMVYRFPCRPVRGRLVLWSAQADSRLSRRGSAFSRVFRSTSPLLLLAHLGTADHTSRKNAKPARRTTKTRTHTPKKNEPALRKLYMYHHTTFYTCTYTILLQYDPHRNTTHVTISALTNAKELGKHTKQLQQIQHKGQDKDSAFHRFCFF